MDDVNTGNRRDGRAPRRDATIARSHRAVLGALAAAAALVGAWAQVAPHSFYADFPGLRQFWVSFDGPYNEHLIRDVGGLNLGLAVLTATAAIHGRATLAPLAAACWLIFSVPHFAYHVTHLGPFGAIDATAQVVSLALQVAAPLWVVLTTQAMAKLGHSSWNTTPRSS
jgi:hypothetical protein